MKDINVATKEELVEVPTISPSRAETIVNWRDSHGPVNNINELTEIPGIGEKTVQRMSEFFTASGTQQDDPEEGEEAGEGEEEGEEAGEDEDGEEGEGEEDGGDDEEDGDPEEDGDEDADPDADPDEAA